MARNPNRKPYVGQIPFCPNTGSLQSYPTNFTEWLPKPDNLTREEWDNLPWNDKRVVHGPVWKDNFVFYACLTATDFMRGRSAARVVMVDDDDPNLKYEMFLTDWLHMMKNSVMRFGEVAGHWTFTKRGSNFGLMLVEPGVAYGGDEDYAR